MHRLFLALPLLGAAAAPLQAQDDLSDAAANSAVERERGWGVAGYWDNDGGIIKPNAGEDNQYTNGLGFTFTYQPDWAADLADAIPLGEGMNEAGVGLVGGQFMFTPDDLTASSILEDDRPYAGYAFAGLYLDRASETTQDRFRVELGTIGEASLAEGLQEWIHEWYGGDEPEGWGNQVEDPVTIQTYATRKWKLELAPVEVGERQIGVELIPQAGVALGTVHRHIEAAATLRAGFNLPGDFGPGRLSDPASATGDLRGGWYGYVFGRAGGRAVEHNAYLEGNSWGDRPHTVDPEPLVGELTGGLAMGYRHDGWAAEVSYAQTVQSHDFKGQDAYDEFASLMLSVSGGF